MKYFIMKNPKKSNMYIFKKSKIKLNKLNKPPGNIAKVKKAPKLDVPIKGFT